MTYTEAFYAEEGRVARESALVVLPRILGETHARTVIDIGCCTGQWAAVASELGCEVRGVDWNVPGDLTVIDTYIDHDLSLGYSCAGWDLAVCLEVAEHLPAEASVRLVEGLADATAVLFSAATPGQPGVGHINCQPHDYWHALFADCGLEPTHVGNWFSDPVADFYRRNMFLYRCA